MIQVYRTSKRKQEKLKRVNDLDFKNDYFRDRETVIVDTSQTFQTHLGFGAGLTEAAALNAAAMGENRKLLIDACYSEKGLRYNLGRVPINSTDFSREGIYVYIPDKADNLDKFDMSREDELVAPFIRDCAAASGNFRLMATPWSAPYWFKSNEDMCYGGKLKPEYKKLWAQYMCRYVEEMAKRGLKIEFMSVQNEPEAVQVWESMSVTAEEESEFIAEYLAPELKARGLDVKLIIWDHNRDRVVRRANVTLSNKKASEAVWGVGYHWYVSDKSSNLTALHTLFPDKHIIFTEGCVELTNTAYKSGGEEYIGEWSHGERYGRNIINDLNNYTEGWIDWNMALDLKGGPTHVGNYCEAPIMVDAESKSMIFNPSYYYIAHFSKFIDVGAKRVMCINDAEKEVYSVAYKNPNGETVVVIQNEGWVRELALVVDGKGVNISMPDNSIITLKIK